MLSDAYISAPVLTGNDVGFYKLLGVLAIVIGVISLLLVALLAKPNLRRTIVQAGQDHPDKSFLQSWEERKPGDPFDQDWERQQAAFTDQVLRAEPDTLTDTLIPGVVPVPLPPETGRPTLAAIPMYGVVVDEIPEQPEEDEGDRVLREIREGNRAFLAKIDAL